MQENDTLKLLRECDAGVKMGVASINDVISDVKSQKMRDYLADCRNQHETLLSDIKERLSAHCDKGKEPAPAAKSRLPAAMSASAPPFSLDTNAALHVPPQPQ